MKRLLIVLIALVAVFALVFPASAADFKFGGMFWTKFYSTNNIQDGNDDSDDNVNGFYTRMRMYFTAIASENLKAVSKVEMDATWGNARLGRVQIDGGSRDDSGFEIKNAYIDFTVPDTALNFKVGLVGTKLGKSGIVFNDDAPAIIASYTYDPVKFSLVYSRLNDNAGLFGDDDPLTGQLGSISGVTPMTANNSNDDWDLWGFDIGYRHEAFSVNLDVAYVVTGDNQDSDFADKNDVDLWIIGVDADYKADLWSAYLTAAFNFGDIEGTFEDAFGNPQDSDFKGWMFSIGGDYNINDMFTVAIDSYVATGNELGDTDAKSFVTPGIIGRPSYYLDDIVFPGWFDDETTQFRTLQNGGPFNNNVSSTGLTGSNSGYTLTNIWSVGAHVDIKPLEQTLIQPGIAYMQFMKSRVEKEAIPGIRGQEIGKDLGFSAYVRLNQGITDGLALKATFGYLFAGDAFSPVDDVDDAYKFGTGLFWSW
jgi:hypothetical protein